MDEPVALVETYLRLHGYFTVTEYPVVEAFGAFASAQKKASEHRSFGSRPHRCR